MLPLRLDKSLARPFTSFFVLAQLLCLSSALTSSWVWMGEFLSRCGPSPSPSPPALARGGLRTLEYSLDVGRPQPPHVSLPHPMVVHKEGRLADARDEPRHALGYPTQVPGDGPGAARQRLGWSLYIPRRIRARLPQTSTGARTGRSQRRTRRRSGSQCTQQTP